jgi:hypothetical protein
LSGPTTHHVPNGLRIGAVLHKIRRQRVPQIVESKPMIFGNGNHPFGCGSEVVFDQHGWNQWRFPILGITSGLPVIRTSGTDTVHFSSKVSDLFASQRICLSLWLCGGFHFFRLFATPPGTVPSNFRMSPFFPTTQPRCASAKPIVLVSSSFICSQFFPRSIE